MIKQCKGKDISNVPASKLLNTGWLASIKYDGNYVQIHKTGNTVRFFTSGNKEFYHELAAEELLANNSAEDFILEAEYIANSDGKLGDRTKAAKLTSYRTNFSKGIANIGLGSHKDIFMVFDVIILNKYFVDRLYWLNNSFKTGNIVKCVTFTTTEDLQTAKGLAVAAAKDGYEGMYLKHYTHVYEPGKRVNSAIKLKLRPTADLLCVAVTEGEGKYTGMIGSLVLKDTKGRVVSVGSGLDDILRAKNASFFIGKIIEVEYEQIIDTYIQPTFIRVRYDKVNYD